MSIKQNYTIGSWITLAHPAIAEIMCKSGFDWLTVDLEHSVITIREAEELIRIIHLSNVSPFVRLTNNDENQIKRVMDAGAHGIIVPMVKTKSDAEKAIKYVKYPPLGIRGVGLARAQGYGSEFKEYNKWLKNEVKIIVQIEHVDSINNLNDIISLKHINGIFIGPYDLSASLGIPGDFENKMFKDAIKYIEEECIKKDVKMGIHIVEPNIDQLKKKIEQNYYYLAYSLDTRILDTSCRDAIGKIKK